MNDRKCVCCGKELRRGDNFSYDPYFCSNACAEGTKWGYVLLACDGDVKVFECDKDDDLDRDVLPRHEVADRWCCGFRPSQFAEPDFLGVYPFAGVSRRCFDRTRYAELVNRGAWTLCGEIVLGDVIFAGEESCYGGKGGWLPLRKAEEIAGVLRARIDRTGLLPIPEDRFWERFVDSPNGPFFERCRARGLLYPMHVIVQFTKMEDLGLVRDYTECCLNEDGSREGCLIDANEDGYFCDFECCVCPTEKWPLNEMFEFLRPKEMSDYVASGRVKVFCGLRFNDLASFERFREEEGDFEGVDWKVVVRDPRGGLKSRDAEGGCAGGELLSGASLPRGKIGPEDLAGCRNADAVLVATSFPLKWLDKSPCRVIELCEKFEKARA